VAQAVVVAAAARLTGRPTVNGRHDIGKVLEAVAHLDMANRADPGLGPQWGGETR
jgi:hypothetical protein